MTGFLIAASILLFLALVLLIRVGFSIEYSGDDVKLFVSILGIPIKLLPKKKKRIKLSDFSKKALEKRQKKEEKKKLKQKNKKERKKLPEDKPQGSGKEPLSDKISFIYSLVKYLLGRFFGYLRIDLTRIKISVGSDDAAKTAILFGIINQCALGLLALLNTITNVKKSRKSEISVKPDFTSDKIESDIKIAFSIKVWQVAALGLGTLFRFVFNMIKKQNSDIRKEKYHGRN